MLNKYELDAIEYTADTVDMDVTLDNDLDFTCADETLQDVSFSLANVNLNGLAYASCKPSIRQLFNVIGEKSSLSGSRFSLEHRGAIEAIRLYGKDTAINLMLTLGYNVNTITTLVRIAKVQS